MSGNARQRRKLRRYWARVDARDYISDLAEVLESAGLTACLWFGRAPCPHCNGDHGDPNATDERDAELREIVASHQPE